MPSAFDIINRENLAQIVKTNFDKEVYRMMKILLSNTTLGVIIQKVALSKTKACLKGMKSVVFCLTHTLKIT